MSEQSIDLTDAVTPENPETAKKIQKYLVIATGVAVGAFVTFKAVQKFTERKSVVVTVADQPDA